MCYDTLVRGVSITVDCSYFATDGGSHEENMLFPCYPSPSPVITTIQAANTSKQLYKCLPPHTHRLNIFKEPQLQRALPPRDNLTVDLMSATALGPHHTRRSLSEVVVEILDKLLNLVYSCLEYL